MLTDDEKRELINTAPCRYDLVESVIAAYEAKLREQEPVGYFYQGHNGEGWCQASGLQFKEAYKPLFEHPAPIPKVWTPAEFIHQFKRHVGGDGEFWLHELEDFYTNMAAARSGE